MTTNIDDFPDDDNGDVLRRMKAAGDNLAKPREVDFSVIFPTEDAALEFAVHMLREGLKVSFAEYEEHDEMPWQVQVHPYMVPAHEAITAIESQLEADAGIYGGRNDGWGCMAQE